MRHFTPIPRSAIWLPVIASIAAGSLAAALLGTSAAAAAAATPACGTSISGTVVFASDLACAGNGLYVEDGVSATIDLNGYVLSGNQLDFTAGVTVSVGARVTIRNGTIRDFGRGVLASSALVTLDGVQLLNNVVDGMYAPGCTGCRVVDSVVTGNGQKGLVFDASSDRALVQGTLLSLNDDDAIYAIGNSIKILGNTVANNGERGIRIGGTGNTVSGNLVGGNVGRGIVVETGSADSVITRNTVTGGSMGIHVDGASDTTVQQNTVVQPGAEGILIEISPRSTVSRNTVTACATSGIYVDALSPDAEITSNASIGNGGAGFFSVNASAAYKANRARGNALEGFDLGGVGAVDGGKNTAAGNLGGGCEAPLDCP